MRCRPFLIASSLAVELLLPAGRELLAQPTPAGPPFEVTGNVGVSALPDVAISRDGRFLVAWQTNGYSSSVLGQRFDRSSRPLGGTLLLSGNGASTFATAACRASA